MKWFHRHKWEATGADSGKSGYVAYHALPVDAGVRTWVMYVCRECGKNRVESFAGEFTIEQVRVKDL